MVIPTALSVDAFITAASGIRRDGCVYYIETKPPEDLILDLDVIAAGPESIRAAGITDVMSIATGSWDWKFAHERGKNPPGMEFIPWVYENARVILGAVLDCAEAAGAGDRQGLKTLYDCLALEVQLCNQVGHARPRKAPSTISPIAQRISWVTGCRMATWWFPGSPTLPAGRGRIPPGWRKR